MRVPINAVGTEEHSKPLVAAGDMLRTIRELKEAVARLDDVPVHVGAVDGVDYFLPRKVADQARLWSPVMERPGGHHRNQK